MRKNPTEAEAFLWENIRNKALGIEFKRQVVILDYIVDFYAPEQQLVIEVDGGYHDVPEQVLLDGVRAERLEAMGYNILRFINQEVLNEIETVLYKIRFYIYNVL